MATWRCVDASTRLSWDPKGEHNIAGWNVSTVVLDAMARAHRIADSWTCVSYLYGVHAYAVSRWGWPMTFFFCVAWEVFENSWAGSAAWAWLFNTAKDSDAAINSVGDITAAMAGWFVAEFAASSRRGLY